MPRMIWLTNIDTAEPVGTPVDKIVLIEQKRPQDGGAVAIYLTHDKEIYVSESLSRIAELLEEGGVPGRQPISHLRAAGGE
jgi:hypothetical protein